MTMKEVDCLVCGTCVADILVRPVSLSTPVGGGRLIHVDPIDVTTGGIVCNTGIAMRRLGMRVAASSLVGADQWGSLIRSRLEAERLDTATLAVHPTLATSTTAVLIDPSGERSFAHHVGAPHAINVGFLQSQSCFLTQSRLAVIGYFGLLPSLEPAFAEGVALVKKAGCTVAVETAGSGGNLADLAPALPMVDIYVPSLDEATHQTGLHDPRAIIDCYRGHGATGLVGVKLGTKGALLSPSADEFVDIPCLPAPGAVADTTGAGDSFLAGLLTGLLRGLPTREAGLLGAATAAYCVTGLGATAGLRSFDETIRLTEEVPATKSG
jgi:sugar/nucleoside kinase (ribokinase family)